MIGSNGHCFTFLPFVSACAAHSFFSFSGAEHRENSSPLFIQKSFLFPQTKQEKKDIQKQKGGTKVACGQKNSLIFGLYCFIFWGPPTLKNDW